MQRGRININSMSLRAHVRYPLKARVVVSWEDDRGIARLSHGKCVDISERGVGLLIDDPIPERNYVSFEIRAIKLHCSGSVRFARRRGLKHFLGIEFSGSRRWDPETHALPCP